MNGLDINHNRRAQAVLEDEIFLFMISVVRMRIMMC
jgi:hypothetical protein